MTKNYDPDENYKEEADNNGELYNLEVDQYEKNNLKEKNPDKVSLMKNKLRQILDN